MAINAKNDNRFMKVFIEPHWWKCTDDKCKKKFHKDHARNHNNTHKVKKCQNDGTPKQCWKKPNHINCTKPFIAGGVRCDNHPINPKWLCTICETAMPDTQRTQAYNNHMNRIHNNKIGNNTNSNARATKTTKSKTIKSRNINIHSVNQLSRDSGVVNKSINNKTNGNTRQRSNEDNRQEQNGVSLRYSMFYRLNGNYNCNTNCNSTQIKHGHQHNATTNKTNATSGNFDLTLGCNNNNDNSNRNHINGKRNFNNE